jgi:hypothetical protein
MEEIRGEWVIYAFIPSSSTLEGEKDANDNPKKVQVVLAEFADLML